MDVGLLVMEKGDTSLGSQEAVSFMVEAIRADSVHGFPVPLVGHFPRKQENRDFFLTFLEDEGVAFFLPGLTVNF